ncbi:DUF6371 domain-containing protein [Sunxiuqinia sp. sy24]|uniref:DUF6371 domain-containing protein n=1 Tax=Sunxiuqinia sp. sy24 TaxID=3461495 RepID=UPI0040459622
MNNYKYQLETYSGKRSRHTCPLCGKSASFVRYIDSYSGNYIAEMVGRCNREHKCGYHYTPKQYFADHGLYGSQDIKLKTPAESPIRLASQIEFKQLEMSLKKYDQNNLVIFLNKLLGNCAANQLVAKYYIGTSTHWNGATVFWQVDINGKIRTGKVMLYDSESGKRVKVPYNHITWAHNLLTGSNYHLNQCFFGEHLLRNNSKTVVIVESEKTAVIACYFFPEFIWLASGGSSNLNIEKFKVLAGRKVVLYPDLDNYTQWASKAKSLQNEVQVSVSRLLNSIASPLEKEKGLDLADYLINYHLTCIKNESPKTINTERLLEVALKVIGQNNHVHRSLIPHIEEMIKQKIISKALPLTDYFYLAESFPF